MDIDLPYRFLADDVEHWKPFLEENGYVVVGNAVSREESAQALTQMKETLCKLSSDLDMQDPNSWGKAKNYPFLMHGGMNQYVGHAKFQWRLRELVAPIFATLWGVEVDELATSFDGFCYMDGRRNYREKSMISFVHTDQSGRKNVLWAYQGVLNLCENGEKDGGFVCVPGSHKAHQEIMKKFGKENLKDDWYKFTDEEKKDEIFKKAFKVCCKTGDLILWDSRTFHCNTIPTSRNPRACTYICMIPQNKISEKARTRRKKAWDERRCTGHYPGEGITIFPVLPRFSDQGMNALLPEIAIEENDLTDLQRILLCID